MENSQRKYVPKFLREKFELAGTVTFAALFSIVVLLLGIPFSHNAWFRLGNSVFFLFTALFALGSITIIIISRVIMYKTRRDFRLKWGQYVLWCAGEIIIICLLYTIFTVTIAAPEDMSFAEILFRSFLYGLICLGIPYVIAGLIFTIVHQEKIIRLINMRENDDPVSDSGELPAKTPLEKITLFDNSGVLKLSVSGSDLYYIESDDNYIKVWYTDGKGTLKTYMLRCRLKAVEESFQGSDLVRCHRKFIVNMSKVKVLRKEKDGYELDLDNDQIPPIPVTKTYTEGVLSHFAGRID